MVVLSVILYFICMIIYFIGSDLLRKISIFTWLGISLFFAVLNMNSIIKAITYIVVGVIGFILLNYVLSKFKMSGILKGAKDSEPKVKYENIRIPSIGDESTQNVVSAEGKVEDFIITVYIKGKIFEFKVVNGEITSYRSNTMKNFADYGVETNEE